jgi:hypothetical protein
MPNGDLRLEEIEGPEPHRADNQDHFSKDNLVLSGMSGTSGRSTRTRVSGSRLRIRILS